MDYVNAGFVDSHARKPAPRQRRDYFASLQ